jgi:DnaJ-class molecular chaperone
VDTLEGGVQLIVPPLTQQGDRLRVRSKGILNPRRGTKGDHFVDVT